MQNSVGIVTAGVVVWLAASFAAPPASEASALGGTGISVPVHQSRVIPLEQRAKRVSLSRPEIAEVMVVSPRQLLVNGKAVGATSLVVWDEGQLVRQFHLRVTPDVDGLETELRSLFPAEAIDVSASGSSIVLRGTVSNEVIYDKVLEITETHLPPQPPEEIRPADAPATVMLASQSVHLPQTGTAFAGGGQLAFREEAALTDAGRWREKRRTSGIIDLLVIRDFRQVRLDVVVAEISLTKLREIGVDWTAFGRRTAAQSLGGSQAGFPSGPLTTGGVEGTPDGLSVPFNPGAASAVFAHVSGSASIAAVFRLLQNREVTNILAEPKLVIKNGRSGGFLSGGEFPFPAPQSSGGLGFQSVTVEFRPFGVRLDFVPTVTWSGTIDLQVFPEVSEIDPSASIRVAGVSVPGLKVRRSVSRVEMRPDETLVIGGLLDSRTLRDLTKFPFFGDLPVIGALFSSTRFRDQETELVFVVTPRIVSALPAGQQATLPSFDRLADPNMRQVPLPDDPPPILIPGRDIP